ncbi:Integrator complex subunit 9 [Coemansia brasiliensis]|uniref:Integrator complex subunit 9 n=1 Tax=Coemansia brasiliensis TaxID=2650707 RepID=A0A9W8IBF9_9FUNG|nr:Integrator complex subunit 9 [Coemansia brasiliensis]
MFVVDCGWPTESYDDEQTAATGKSQTSKSARENPRDALSSVNWGRVDFILVSNYEQMTLLPYITEYTDFTGPIYATEPTKVYGRCVLEDGLQIADANRYLTSSNVGSTSSMQQLTENINEKNLGDGSWKTHILPYTRQDIDAAMEKVHDVRLNEIITPVPFVQVFARSSGYCIGGANWTVEYKNHRTAFISTSAFATCLHPQEWDGSILDRAQAIVFCDAVDPAEAENCELRPIPPNVQVSQRINQLCSTAISTLKKRSRVMLIGNPYGVTQDILQVVAENVISLNLPLPQFIFVSPIAERTLQYGNIMGEWLCAAKQAMLYLPEYPFADKDLRQKGHLHFVKSLSDLAAKNIPQGIWFVVVSPQDTASIDHFIRQWQLDAKQCSSADMTSGTGTASFAVLMHDDDVARAQRIVNRISASNEVTFVPVSQRLTWHAIEECLTNASDAQHVLVPSYIYSRLPASLSSKLELKILEYSYLQATVIDLDIDRHLPLSIQKEMALRLKRDGKQHAVVSGQLVLGAGEIRLESISSSSDGASDGNEGKPDVKASVSASEQLTATAAGNVRCDLSKWSPEKLANELNELGLNASVAIDGLQANPKENKLVRIVLPSGAATIRMHGGWSVECTSVNAQWAVLDSLRQVLGSN